VAGLDLRADHHNS